MEAQVAASLCPPPEVFAGQPVLQHLMVKHASGAAFERTAIHVPLAADALDEMGVLTVLTDTEHGWNRVLGTVTEASELHQRLVGLRQRLLQHGPIHELLGTSSAIRRVRDQLQLALQAKTRVLVCGPRGSGREHVARLIQRSGLPREAGPIVPLCCPLMDAELLQTTVRAFLRQFGAADAEQGPTLLLADVDQLPGDAQRELAGFFQLPDFELHTVSTAQRSLIDLARQGEFMVELAAALSTLVIEMPALADRREDIPLLCQHFLEAFNRDHDRLLSGFAPESMDELVGYGWPDNVDELAEIVEQSCQAADGPFVQVGDLAEPIRWAAQAAAHPAKADQPIVFDELMAEIEKELIRHALQRSKGNKTRAARLLGMSRARLHRRIEFFELN